MMFQQNYLNKAIELITMYEGEMPLHLYLKNYFRSHRQMGSRDRKNSSRLVFACYRLGKALKNLQIEQRLAAALFLTEHKADVLNQYIIAEFSDLPLESISLSLDDKLGLIHQNFEAFRLEDLFPFSGLSHTIDQKDYCRSMLIQPSLWLRLKPGFASDVISILKNESIPFHIEDNRLMLEAGVDLKRLKIDPSFYEVQDRSSQLTGSYYKPGNNETWFDSCAASGGKSLLLYSINDSVHITANDIRQSSLINLRERFKRNGVKNYNVFSSDLAIAVPEGIQSMFDGIIADVPCTGSGTWSRSPERISFFKEEEISRFNELQFSIIKNIVPLLKHGKPIIYITCSVFRAENELMTERISKELNLQPEMETLIIGCKNRADTMFVSRLIRN